MPTERATNIANAFVKYAKNGDKSVIKDFSREEIEATLLQYHQDKGWPAYVAMEKRVEELREEDHRIRIESNLKLAEANVRNTRDLVGATKSQAGQNERLVNFTRLLAIATILLAIATVIAPLVLNHIQYKQKKADELQEIEDDYNDALVRLHREISENRFLLETQLQKSATTKTKLPTIVWDTKKYLIDFDKKFLLEGISLVYDEIRTYNEACNYIGILRGKGGMTKKETRESFNEPLNIIVKALIDKLEALEILTFQELVKKDLIEPEKWDEEKRGRWDKETLVPRIKVEAQIEEEETRHLDKGNVTESTDAKNQNSRGKVDRGQVPN
jgi:hypothetical protein